ncbi:MAG: ribonuclease III [Deltaproteobacteria bacterium]|nr:ribonuclease III [Deltaproteobacteria bacterium]
MFEDRFKKLKTLEEFLCYEFTDIALLDGALTHRSFINENQDMKCEDNERLEFLGDAVLQLCVSDILIRQFPYHSEGRLSKLRASLVNEQPLAMVALDFHIGDFILLGKGEETSGGRSKSSILADAFEAVTAAIYLDKGYKKAFSFINNIFKPRIETWGKEPVYQDYKSRLQELCQSRLKTIPKYELMAEFGPDHDKTFEIRVSAGTIISEIGKGKNKKEAEQRAAGSALQKLETTKP